MTWVYCHKEKHIVMNSCGSECDCYENIKTSGGTNEMD